MNFLKVENLQKSFGKIEVIKNLSFSLKRGEVLAIIGSSGSGKTTLLRCLNFLETPQKGKITVGDKVLFDSENAKTQTENEKRRNRLHFGLVFQSFNLFPQYSVIDNIMLAPLLIAKSELKTNKTYYECKSYKEAQTFIKDCAVSLLKKVGLSEKANAYPCELSGGQQQRVALARALTLDSQILLMDEPFSALDKQTSNRLRKELQEIWMNMKKTILFITHSVEEAVYLGDRVVVMSDVTGGIKDVVEIGLERPRYVYDERFVQYRHRILDEVQGDE